MPAATTTEPACAALPSRSESRQLPPPGGGRRRPRSRSACHARAPRSGLRPVDVAVLCTPSAPVTLAVMSPARFVRLPRRRRHGPHAGRCLRGRSRGAARAPAPSGRRRPAARGEPELDRAVQVLLGAAVEGRGLPKDGSSRSFPTADGHRPAGRPTLRRQCPLARARVSRLGGGGAGDREADRRRRRR